MTQRDTPLAMRDLVAATGVHRQTIHRYIREGLLPSPAEAESAGHQRYGPQYVALLHLIRELRDDGLPLDIIRRRLSAAGFDPEVARRQAATERSLEALARSAPTLLTAREVAEAADLPPARLRALVEAGIVAPHPKDERGRFIAEWVDVGRAVRDLEAEGVPAEAVMRLGRLAGAVAAAEIAALASEVGQTQASVDELVAQAERRHGMIDGLLSAVRRAEIARALRDLVDLGPRTRSFAAEGIYVPSPLFIRRFGLEAALEQAQAEATRPDSDATSARTLGRLLLGLGRYDEAVQWLTTSARRDDDCAETYAYLGLGCAILGRSADGLSAAQRAVDLDPTSPRARAFAGVVRALFAGVESPSALAVGDLLAEAIRDLQQAARLPAADLREELEVKLAIGRVLTVLPHEMSAHVDGLAALRSVVEQTGALDDDFDFPGAELIYRINALYYLGMAARDAGDHAQALEQLNECVTLDPASRFAHAAYEIITALDRQSRRGEGLDTD